MRLRTLQKLAVLIFIAASLSAAGLSQASPEILAPPAGWEFVAKPTSAAKPLIFQPHEHQIGTLRQIDLPPGVASDFLTTPLILRPALGLGSQNSNRQFLRLEAEIRSIVQKGQRTEPLLKSERKFLGERARIENEYGKKQGDRLWVHASTHRDSVLIVWGVSRSSRLTDEKAQKLRENFFEMARALKTTQDQN